MSIRPQDVMVLGLIILSLGRDLAGATDGVTDERTPRVGSITPQKGVPTASLADTVISTQRLDPRDQPVPNSANAHPAFKLAGQDKPAIPDAHPVGEPGGGLTADTATAHMDLPGESVNRPVSINIVDQPILPPRECSDIRTKPAPRAECAMTDALEFWRAELAQDAHRTYILNGIEFGFSLVDDDDIPLRAYRSNYRSALDNSALVELKMRNEIALKRYIVCEAKPQIISSLGVVPKQNGDIRLIHDLSRPRGGVNQYALETSVTYSTLDKALSLIVRGTHLAKVDLKDAYRAVPIHPSCFALTGLSWKFAGDSSVTYLYDARLPFGAAKSCRIFQTLTDSIVQMMAAKNFQIIGYLDDFLCIEDTIERCNESFVYLQGLLTSLGFTINPKKVEGPTQNITFLGVAIDCVARTLSLPESKLLEMKLLCKSWLSKHKCTKRDLQSLIGKLNWCSRVLKGGRTFARRLINLLCKVALPSHHIRITAEARADIEWWVHALQFFHGTAQFPADIPVPSFVFSTDACPIGGGGHYGQDWFFSSWVQDYPQYASSHINVLELLSVKIAVERWGHKWKGLHIMVRSDNGATVAAVNNASSRSPELLTLIHELYWLSVKYDFKLSASHIPGVENVLSDGISRMFDVDKALLMKELLMQNPNSCMFCLGHMSKASFLFLQDAWSPKWTN